MTNTADLLAGLVAAAEEAVKRAEASQKERRADAQSAGVTAFESLFGVTPPAHTPSTSPSAGEHAAEVAAIRADLAALTGATEPGTETPPAEHVDADLTRSDPGADSGAEGQPKAPVKGSSSPETDAAFLSMLNDN